MVLQELQHTMLVGDIAGTVFIRILDRRVGKTELHWKVGDKSLKRRRDKVPLLFSVWYTHVQRHLEASKHETLLHGGIFTQHKLLHK